MKMPQIKERKSYNIYIIHKRQRKETVSVAAVASVFEQKKSHNSNKKKKQVVSRPVDSVADGRLLEELPLVVTATSPVTFDLWTFHS